MTQRLRQLVLDQQRVHLDHPGLAHFALVRHSRSTAAFRWLDSILEVLHEGGLDDDDVVACLNQIGFLQNPLIYLDAPERVFEAQTSLMDPSHRRVLAQPERFPYLAKMADKVPGRPYEANFELALDTVIAALEARVRGRPVARDCPTDARSRTRSRSLIARLAAVPAAMPNGSVTSTTCARGSSPFILLNTVHL